MDRLKAWFSRWFTRPQPPVRRRADTFCVWTVAPVRDAEGNEIPGKFDVERVAMCPVRDREDQR